MKGVSLIKKRGDGHADPKYTRLMSSPPNFDPFPISAPRANPPVFLAKSDSTSSCNEGWVHDEQLFITGVGYAQYLRGGRHGPPDMHI